MADDLTPKRPVLYDADGRPIQLDRDGPLPHVYTFQGLLSGSWATYWMGRHDEAMRHHRANALAMFLDEHIQSCLWERVRSSTKLKWRLEVDNPRDPRQKLVADGLTKAIKQTPRLRQYKRWLLWQALWAGRAGNQMKLDWGEVETEGAGRHRALVVGGHKPINGDKLAFRWDDTPAVLVSSALLAELPNAETILTTEGRAVVLKGAWRERVVIHKVNVCDVDFRESDRAEAIHGLGCRHWLYWSWWNKQEYISAVLKSLDRVGLGLIVVEYDEGNPTAKDEATKLARNMSVDRSVVTVPVPKDRMGASGAVRVVNTPVAGAQVMLQLQAACELREERFIVAQAGSSRSDTSGMGTHDPAMMQESKSDVVEEDAGELDETLTGNSRDHGLVYLLKKYTYPWADFPVRHVTDVSPPDPERRLGSATMAFNLGVDLIADEVREVAGFTKPGPDDHALVNPQIVQAMQQLEMQAQQQQAQQGQGGPPGPDGQAPGGPSQPPPGGGPDQDFARLFEQGGGAPGSAGGHPIEPGAPPGAVPATPPQPPEGPQQFRRDGTPLRYAGEPGAPAPVASAPATPAAHPPPVIKAPPFHSRLQNALGGLGNKPLPAQAVFNRVKKAGVPDEEWHAAKMPAALEGRQQVHPQELQQHYEANKVMPQEEWKGHEPMGPSRAELESRYYELSRRNNLTPEEDAERVDLHGRILNPPPPNPPRYEDYQTPGGDNYRELLLHLPQSPAGEEASRVRDEADEREQRGHEEKARETDYQSPHWDTPNVVAHARMHDRVLPNGEKALHVEEVQSDWHQGGRKKGYTTGVPRQALQQEISHLNREYDRIRREGGGVQELSAVGGRIRELEERVREMSGAVPDAPYKDSWPTLALKRLLYHAAENGHDRLTLNSGKQIQSLVGGEEEGQNEFYDKVLPNVLAKLAKPYGVKPEKAAIPSDDLERDAHFARTQQAIKESAIRDYEEYLGRSFPGVPFEQLPVGDRNHLDNLRRTAADFRRRAEESSAGFPVTSLQITPEMRRSILATGFPHMEEGGTAEGGPTVLQPGEVVHPQPWRVPLVPGADPNHDSVVAPLHPGDVVQPVQPRRPS